MFSLSQQEQSAILSLVGIEIYTLRFLALHLDTVNNNNKQTTIKSQTDFHL